jgi:hypothetical protein
MLRSVRRISKRRITLATARRRSFGYHRTTVAHGVGPEMRIHQWQLRGRDRAVKEILPETAPTVVGHGIIDDAMLYLTARRADDGALFRVFLTPDDLRRLVRRAMEQEETAAVVREIAG